jgi:hypothetical protein
MIGILLALQVNNWNNQRLQVEKETQYLNILIEDLNRQLNLIESQIKHELKMAANCEEALRLIQEDPINIEELNKMLYNSGRKSFVVAKALFEELKYSGNLSIISNAELRNDIMSYFNDADFIEKGISNNNDKWVDGFDQFLLNNVFIDWSYNSGETTISTQFKDFDLSLDVEKHENMDEIIKSELKDERLKARLYNNLIYRGKNSKFHVLLLKVFENKTAILITKIKDQIQINL